MLKQSKEFWAKIVHDLGSPLSVIKGYVDYRYKASPDSTDEILYLGAMKKSIAKIERIADQIRATLDEETPAPVETEEQIAEIRKQLDLHDEPVLIIDDDSSIITQWELHFRNKNCHVMTARRGEDLVYHDFDYKKIKAAIVDFQYDNSQLNGFDVIRFLKKRGVARVYLCTAQGGDQGIRNQALALGAEAIITKPIHHGIFA